MRSQFILLIFFLTPALLILNSDFSWEALSIRTIHRIGDRTSVRKKLTELGFTTDEQYENFRYREIIVTFLFIVGEFLLLTFLDIDPFKILLLSLSTSCGVIFILERNLDLEVTRHREAIDSEFPAIVEMMTLALSAGETPLTSMQRISRRAHGALAREFAQVIEEVFSERHLQMRSIQWPEEFTHIQFGGLSTH
jgi:tight adherence protein C